MSILFMTEAILFFGWVAEWSNAPVSKTGMAATPSWVQIPPHPPIGGSFPKFVDIQSKISLVTLML